MSDDGTGSELNRLRLDDAAYFVYTGQEDVPWDVIHVRIHPSVRVIRRKAFKLRMRIRGEAFIGRVRLLSVEFHDQLEVIEELSQPLPAWFMVHKHDLRERVTLPS